MQLVLVDLLNYFMESKNGLWRLWAHFGPLLTW